MSAVSDAEPARAPRTVELLGVPFDVLTEADVIAGVLDSLDRGAGGCVQTINLDVLRQWIREPDAAALHEPGDLVVADGMPLLWAARLQGTPLPGRVAGSNLIYSLTAGAAARGRSIFLIGGNPGTADATARILAERSPGLRVAGVHCPAFGFDRDPAAIEGIRRMLVDARPDVVYLGLGLSKQNRMIHALRGDLPGAWWLGVGISFSFVSGEVRRAPVWMQKTGLEWAHRLGQEPARLARRYLVDGIPFAARIFLHSAGRRLHLLGKR